MGLSLLLVLLALGQSDVAAQSSAMSAFLGKYSLTTGINQVGTAEVRVGTRDVSYVVITQVAEGGTVHEVELLLRAAGEPGRFLVERKETSPRLRAREGVARAVGDDLVLEFRVTKPDQSVTLLRETWHRRSDGTLLLRTEAGANADSLLFVGSAIAERR